MGRLGSWLSRKARGEGVRPWTPDQENLLDRALAWERPEVFGDALREHGEQMAQHVREEIAASVTAFGDGVAPPAPDPYPLVAVCPRCDRYADAVDEIALTMRLVGPDHVHPGRSVQVSPCGCVVPLDEVIAYRGLGVDR